MIERQSIRVKLSCGYFPEKFNLWSPRYDSINVILQTDRIFECSMFLIEFQTSLFFSSFVQIAKCERGTANVFVALDRHHRRNINERKVPCYWSKALEHGESIIKEIYAINLCVLVEEMKWRSDPTRYV